MPERSIQVLEVARHRNGIDGVPFHVVAFLEGGDRLVAIRFDDSSRSPRIAVLNIDLLNQSLIAFGVNSWRGDQYAPAVDRAIAEWESTHG